MVPTITTAEYDGRETRTSATTVSRRAERPIICATYTFIPAPPGRTFHTSGEHYASNDHRCISRPGSDDCQLCRRAEHAVGGQGHRRHPDRCQRDDAVHV